MELSFNPFSPTIGVMPQYLAGRHAVLIAISRAFVNGVGDPNLSTILIGPRGSGKTTLLSCIADRATEYGWLVVNAITSTGMLEDILERTIEAAKELIEPDLKQRLAGNNIGQFFGIKWTVCSEQGVNWRTKMNAVLEALDKAGVGLLITIDEVNPKSEEMIQLASTYQLFIREGKKVGLVMAGLPKQIINMIDNDPISFLRRSRQQYLGPISNPDIEVAFRKTLEDAGKSITKPAMERAVESIGGYPYMMQLVGFYTWEESGNSKTIALDHVERGVELAKQEFRRSVLESTYKDLSKMDRKFLAAMVVDDGASSLTQVANRMGKGANYASTYKTRLMKLGVIGERPGNHFDFDVPYFREYVKEMEGI